VKTSQFDAKPDEVDHTGDFAVQDGYGRDVLHDSVSILYFDNLLSFFVVSPLAAASRAQVHVHIEDTRRSGSY